MYDRDVGRLACIECRGPLALDNVLNRDSQSDELIEGDLWCQRCSRKYRVRNGIPRFVPEGSDYNASWDYKWTKIDQGRGINYEMIDRERYGPFIHNLFDTNSHGGVAFDHCQGLILPVCCLTVLPSEHRVPQLGQTPGPPPWLCILASCT